MRSDREKIMIVHGWAIAAGDTDAMLECARALDKGGASADLVLGWYADHAIAEGCETKEEERKAS